MFNNMSWVFCDKICHNQKVLQILPIHVPRFKGQFEKKSFKFVNLIENYILVWQGKVADIMENQCVMQKWQQDS
jgi:hypothetical protein